MKWSPDLSPTEIGGFQSRENSKSEKILKNKFLSTRGLPRPVAAEQRRDREYIPTVWAQNSPRKQWEPGHVWFWYEALVNKVQDQNISRPVGRS